MKNNEVKTILIRLDPDTHNKIRHISIDTGISVNAYVVKALKKVIEAHEKEAKNDKWQID